jgi:hypothetical protein
MAILKHWRMWVIAAACLRVGLAASNAQAASSSASAQVIIIMPERPSPPSDSHDSADPLDTVPAASQAPMERTMLFLRDGGTVTILHTETEPL